MKILYIITRGELGGAQRYVLDLANTFSSTNEVIVANGIEGEQFLIDGIGHTYQTHKFKHLIREISLEDILGFFEIRKYIKQNEFDLIHVNSTKAGVLVALAKGTVPSVYTVHGWVFNEPMNWLKRQLYIFIEKISCRRHNKIIVLGQNNKKDAIKLQIADENKIEIIPHGIKNDNVTSRELIQSSYNIDSKNINIVTIANFYKTKGLLFLIKTVRILKKINPNIKLYIFGDGPEKTLLEKEADGLDSIFFLGRIPYAGHALRGFDLFVLPSLKEGLPYAILEAMEAQIPIITTTVGEIPNILENEKTALLVKPADSTALANAIQKLINNPTFGSTLAANAKKRLADFSFESMIEKHQRVYSAMASKA